jgi:hypothetical protein
MSFLWGCGGGGWGGTESTTGLLYQLRVMMSVEQSVECLAGETEVLGENLPECRFIHHDLTRAWTRAADVRSRQLTAWATA